MPFCPECRSLLLPTAGQLKCKKCGYVAKSVESRTVTIPREEREMLVLDEAARRRLEVMPTMEVDCPQCGNRTAYYRTQQTRKSDEPETTFLRCTKCDHRWRKY